MNKLNGVDEFDCVYAKREPKTENAMLFMIRGKQELKQDKIQP
ncbi:hypothetical protein [Stenoxybacter acetivorans]|nr:hypothetical protein [Stenoxybacter acetivorans]